MQPLTITAETPHGVVLARPWGIALDGLLASVLWHERKFAAYAAGVPWRRFDPELPPEDMELPLQRCGDRAAHRDWHWMATFGEVESPEALPDTRWRTSRTDHTRLQQLSSTISPSRVSDRSGRYQNRLVPVLASSSSRMVWRAVGDPSQILELLENLTAIGKHTGSGEGVVTKWSVVVDEGLTEWAAGHEHSPGVLGRPTPQRCLAHPDSAADVASRHTLRTTAIRAPYLHPSSHFPSYLPAY